MSELNDHPLRGDEKDKTVLCPECGYPNRKEDTSCMYCKSSLEDVTNPSVQNKVKNYIEQRKWKKKMLQRKKGDDNLASPSKGTVWQRLSLYSVGIILLLIGIGFFGFSGIKGSFQSWLIGILFLLYGGYTLLHTYRRSG